MGCYGVGVTRALAAVIEQHADDDGVAWPVSVAPFEVAILPLSADEAVTSVAQTLFEDLAAAGIETVMDDRDERAGVKFADADLVGYPYQVVVGGRSVADGVVEVKDRSAQERSTVAIDEAARSVADTVIEQREGFARRC
jgi:prolyl-tRNA synthetase